MGAILAIISLASLSTMLLHGNHLDWFHSQLICVLALISAITLPWFLYMNGAILHHSLNRKCSKSEILLMLFSHSLLCYYWYVHQHITTQLLKCCAWL